MKNVLGTDLKSCNSKPVTGYFRDGFCRTDKSDHGRHVVASVMDRKFLKFSRDMGNDLSSPNLAAGLCLTTSIISLFCCCFEYGYGPGRSYSLHNSK